MLEETEAVCMLLEKLHFPIDAGMLLLACSVGWWRQNQLCTGGNLLQGLGLLIEPRRTASRNLLAKVLVLFEL